MHPLHLLRSSTCPPPPPPPAASVSSLYSAYASSSASSSCSITTTTTSSSSLRQVRAAIRKRDAIAPKNCADYEDCCFSFFCLPCTLCQILRHETQGEAYSLVQLV